MICCFFARLFELQASQSSPDPRKEIPFEISFPDSFDAKASAEWINMGIVGMNISTTINWWMIKRALKIGAYKLDASLYKKVIKAYKTMIIHTLVWIGIATVVGVLLAVSCFQISTKKLEGLLQEHNAVGWTIHYRYVSSY